MLRLLALVSLVACSTHVPEEEERRRLDAAVNGDPSRAGIISCFTSSNPGQTCQSPTPTCCFSNKNAFENGMCQTFSAPCAYGKETCDGAEECPLGWKCFANEYRPTANTTAWDISCHLLPPTTGIVTYTMCHPNGGGTVQCPDGQTCTQVYDAGVFNLPRALYICH